MLGVSPIKRPLIPPTIDARAARIRLPNIFDIELFSPASVGAAEAGKGDDDPAEDNADAREGIKGIEPIDAIDDIDDIDAILVLAIVVMAPAGKEKEEDPPL